MGFVHSEQPDDRERKSFQKPDIGTITACSFTDTDIDIFDNCSWVDTRWQ
jgi:hypothetical protein